MPGDAPPTLSVVIPAFDAAAWLPGTLAAVRAALARAAWPGAELIVVDDGSTDDTAAVLAADAGTPPVRVVHQANQGRLRARLAGLRAARGELVLLCDTRVRPEEGSLAFLRQRLAERPEQRVWNGDVVIATKGNPYAGFWAGVVTIAWRRWFADRTEASFGSEDFDRYPKGTGFFLAPRAELLARSQAFAGRYDDLSLVSDDTHLLRGLAADHPIRLSARFRCTYHGRDDLTGFLRQAFYRGTTFVDGHVRPESRLFGPFLGVAALAPLATVAAVRRPGAVAAAVVTGAGLLGAVARRCGASRHDAGSLALLAPPFAVAYGAGITRGLVLAVTTAGRRSRRGRRAARGGEAVLGQPADDDVAR